LATNGNHSVPGQENMVDDAFLKILVPWMLTRPTWHEAKVRQSEAEATMHEVEAR